MTIWHAVWRGGSGLSVPEPVIILVDEKAILEQQITFTLPPSEYRHKRDFKVTPGPSAEGPTARAKASAEESGD